MVEVWSVVCFITGGFRPIDHERVNLCCTYVYDVHVECALKALCTYVAH